MLKGNKTKKRVSHTDWLPFYNGNKFNKRIASKRFRKHFKDRDMIDFQNTDFYIQKYFADDIGGTTYYKVIELPSKTEIVTAQSKTRFVGTYDQCLDFIIDEELYFV